MIRKTLGAPALLLLVACGGPGTAADGDGSAADLGTAQVDAEEDSPRDAAGAMSEIAVLPFGDGHVVFMETPDGDVVAYGRTPVGGAPMPPDLFDQGVAELYRQLAPGKNVPEALLRAERVEREMSAAAPAEGELPAQQELLVPEIVESDDPGTEYRAPAGEAFGAFEVWFEDNYCGFYTPELDTCRLGLVGSTSTTYKNINTTATYLYVEAGRVTWDLRRGTGLVSTGQYDAGYVYGPRIYRAGAVYYLLYTYWKTATIKWSFVAHAGALFHYSGWATADGGLFIDPPGD